MTGQDFLAPLVRSGGKTGSDFPLTLSMRRSKYRLFGNKFYFSSIQITMPTLPHDRHTYIRKLDSYSYCTFLYSFARN